MADDSNESKPRLLQLNDNNYEAWESRLQDVFYGKGLYSIYEASLTGPAEGEDDEENEGDARENARENARVSQPKRASAWTMVKCSLPPGIEEKVRHIPRGEVEELLRQIRAQYYKVNAYTKNMLKKKLHHAKLEDHADLGIRAYNRFLHRPPSLCDKEIAQSGLHCARRG